MTMPAPIPISRVNDPSSSTSGSSGGIGSYRMGTSYGNSFPSSNSAGGSASFREAMMMATSFGKDVNDIMDYSSNRFGSSVDSEMTIAPSTSQPRLESTFCRDFSCCGQELDDLHDLLQHYEECHVRFDDDGMPGMVEDDGSSSAGSASTPSSVPPSPRVAHQRAATAPGGSKLGGGAGAAGGNHKRVSTLNTDLTSQGLDSTTGASKGKKRSFGQYDASSNAGVNGSSVHQSLRRALIDGGVGSRSGRSSPSVYSANSPFSTPGSSIPGTPVGDDEEFAFAGNSGLSAFSALSLRQSNNDDHLPACAPPNLFFPAPGASSGAGANATTPGMPGLNLPTFSNSMVNAAHAASGAQPPPAKRERMTSSNGVGGQGGSGGGSSSSANVGPGGEKLDKDGKPIEKPFKCPNPGCDKAYKQANGLKYHRLHGSCNRNLAGKAGSSGGNSSNGPSTPTPSGSAAASKGPGSPSTPSPVTANASAAPTKPPQAASSAAPKPAQPPQNAAQAKSPQPPVPPNAAGAPVPAGAAVGASAAKKPAAPTTAGGGPAPFPLPPNINSAALAAAAALLQRGGPLPPSLQGSNGPIDTASLLKTLQMLQAQVAAQQKANGGAPAPGATGAAGAGAAAVKSPPALPSKAAPGAPIGAGGATTATSGQARPPPPRPTGVTAPGQQAKPAGAAPSAPAPPAGLAPKKASPTVASAQPRPPAPPAPATGSAAGQQKASPAAPATSSPASAAQQTQKK
ncbi:hypothetical protein BDZ90DRAFT_34627 [Jaminaea rosea]|uniref:C2H2-type domain-containing protein n=1 Tax=Jaminaea rosea TaxID=1569628 RepID=A0A316V4D4_9BASI|nr:hypothetical protein BDZ90DRAFT_34627 [Jaminaea rosea]PWN31083.1 hypothetical protein BDZ90DRAFT_34627 [Jaminaea rosea]